MGRNDFVVNSGTVTVDTTSNGGAGTLKLQLGSPVPPSGTPLTLLFCPYPTNYQNIAFNYQNCQVLLNFSSSAQSTYSESFSMPKGTWAGVFQVIENGVVFATGGMSTTSPGAGFQSAMLPAASVTGGIGMTVGPDTGSGSMSTNATTLQINIAGALPSHPYNVQLCPIQGGSCTTIGSLTSDASGNVAGSLPTGNFPIFSGEVALSDSSGVEFISAFRSM